MMRLNDRVRSRPWADNPAFYGRLAPALLLIAAGFLPQSAAAQGRTDYFNVESPQVHPLDVFSLGGHDYLVACNTRNNSIEIFDTRENLQTRRLASVPVGLEPVSVRFNAALSRLFVANFLGDSISVIAVAAPAGPQSLEALLIETTWVGDEPMDIAFHSVDDGEGAQTETLFVSHMTLDGIGWRNARTLAPMFDGAGLMTAAVTTQVDSNADGIPDTTARRAAKEPRNLLVRDGQLLVLAAKGGDNLTDPLGFDLDLYCDTAGDPFVAPSMQGNLGTTGFDMAFAGDGTLFAVGAEALNNVLLDELEVAAAPTGFVKSMFYRIEDPCSTDAQIARRDVNLAPDDNGTAVPVGKDLALSQPTSLAIFQPDGAAAPKVFFTAFGNDRIGIIEPAALPTDPNQWPLRRIDVNPRYKNPLAGPNALAIRPARPEQKGDPGARLYVLNHLDNSIATVDPVTETLVPDGYIALAHDPRPKYLTVGQRFLYDAKLSGNGFVSCASCHVHGRTDGLVWDLGAPELGPVEIPPLLADGLEVSEFPADKDGMVTQSLQGLLNFELARADQEWVSNAPYHWRADRESFLDFNGAFESLLGGEMLSDTQMGQFEGFVNSIHYPPNPKQPRGRVASGDFGMGEDLDNDGSSGAQRGIKLFHLESFTASQRSCAMCHSLPEGSNNRITDNTNQPTETAALRGLFQKESRRAEDGSDDPDSLDYTGFIGLFHLGVRGNPNLLNNSVASINGFNRTFFSNRLCGGPNLHCADLQALNQFLHEYDFGTGPLVGCSMTIHADNAADVSNPGTLSSACAHACTNPAATLDCMEQQAGLANTGVAVNAWQGGQIGGYWYDAAAGVYRAESDDNTALTRTELVNALQFRDRLVFQAVPLGSERRVAAADGLPAAAPTGAAPSALNLLPMIPNTFYRDVPSLHGPTTTRDNTQLQSEFLHALRLLQWGLIKDAADENGFGLGEVLREDAPRRFRVSGLDIRHGAKLVLSFSAEPIVPVPDPTPVQAAVGLPATDRIALPLYATSAIDPVSGAPVWETAVELEPLAYYTLMAGGPAAPGVQAALTDEAPFGFPMVTPQLDEPPAGSFAPMEWNWLHVRVRNADGTVGDGGRQRLRIE